MAWFKATWTYYTMLGGLQSVSCLFSQLIFKRHTVSLQYRGRIGVCTLSGHNILLFTYKLIFFPLNICIRILWPVCMFLCKSGDWFRSWKSNELFSFSSLVWSYYSSIIVVHIVVTFVTIKVQVKTQSLDKRRSWYAQPLSLKPWWFFTFFW